MSGSIPLAEMCVTLHAMPDDVSRHLTTQAGLRLIERGDNSLVAEFMGQIGRYHWTTRERVTFDSNRRRITFEQLRRPFFSVRTAIETFDITPGPDDTTVLIVNGTLMPRLGPLGWLVTRWIVRPAWERIEGKHLERLRQRFNMA